MPILNQMGARFMSAMTSENQSEKSGRAVPPTATVRPGGNGADKKQDEDDEQDRRHK
jgi:hypothetical protein